MLLICNWRFIKINVSQNPLEFLTQEWLGENAKRSKVFLVKPFGLFKSLTIQLVVSVGRGDGSVAKYLAPCVKLSHCVTKHRGHAVGTGWTGSSNFQYMLYCRILRINCS